MYACNHIIELEATISMVYLVFRYVSIWLISKRQADVPFQKARLPIAVPYRSNLLLVFMCSYVFVIGAYSTAARLWECACTLFVFTAAAVAAQAPSLPSKKGAEAHSGSPDRHYFCPPTIFKTSQFAKSKPKSATLPSS